MAGMKYLRIKLLGIGEKKMSKMSIYDFLNQFKEQWERVLQQRFMQLIHNFQSYYQRDGFFIENDKFIEMLREYLDTVVKENK